MAAPVSALLAVDPGSAQSGWVIVDNAGTVEGSGVVPNGEILRMIEGWPGPLAVEMIASYGMPVGKEVFDTCLWIGKYLHAHSKRGWPELLIYRREVKQHLCDGNPKATDANVRQALIDLYPATGGGKRPQIGTKAQPGPLYGIHGDAWAALGVAATVRGLR
jgi:hypothetical protein